MWNVILIIIVLILVCLICHCIDLSTTLPTLAIIGGSQTHNKSRLCGINYVGGKGSKENRGNMIEEIRKQYSPENIKTLINIAQMPTGQYIIDNGILKFTSNRNTPPYSGTIYLLYVKRINCDILADFMISLALREYAYIIVINDQTKEITVLGMTPQLENLTLGRSREFLIAYLNDLTDFNKIGFQSTGSLKYEKNVTNPNIDIKWEILSNLTEDDIRRLDWSDLLSKIPDYCSRKFEVGGSADLIGSAVKITKVSDGNVGSVSIPDHGDYIVFHSHPRTEDFMFAELPSVNDLLSALQSYKNHSAALDVIIAQEGLYVYRCSSVILDHEDEIRKKLDNLTTGCYRLKSRQCIESVMTKIRDLGYIIYFIPNPDYFNKLKDNDIVYNYWNTIDNVRFIEEQKKIRLYKPADFDKLDWSEIKKIKQLCGNHDSIIVADYDGNKVVAVGGAACRSSDFKDSIGQPPGRIPALLDILVQNSEKMSGYLLKYISEASPFVGWCILLLPDRSIAIRSDFPIQVSEKSEYSTSDLVGLGFITVEFGKI